jgi:hypothetical protein
LPLRLIKLNTEIGFKMATTPCNHELMLNEENHAIGQDYDDSIIDEISDELGIDRFILSRYVINGEDNDC